MSNKGTIEKQAQLHNGGLAELSETLRDRSRVASRTYV